MNVAWLDPPPSPVTSTRLQAANYLDLKPLLDLTCKTVADYIKQCKTPQEIRRRFNIKNGVWSLPFFSTPRAPSAGLHCQINTALSFADFTPAEEEEVRKENAWCEER